MSSSLVSWNASIGLISSSSSLWPLLLGGSEEGRVLDPEIFEVVEVRLCERTSQRSGVWAEDPPRARTMASTTSARPGASSVLLVSPGAASLRRHDHGELRILHASSARRRGSLAPAATARRRRRPPTRAMRHGTRPI